MPPEGSVPGIPNYGQTYWRDRWRQKSLALLETRKSEGNSFWNDKKAIKSHFIRDLNEWRDTAETRIAGMGIRDGSRVLDIGAGTGVLSVPLAAHGCEVTAVEPSPVMGETLLEYQREEKCREITLIPKRWEDVTLQELGAPFDTVIASYSLMVTDIGEAVLKMHQSCRGTVAHFLVFNPTPLGSGQCPACGKNCTVQIFAVSRLQTVSGRHFTRWVFTQTLLLNPDVILQSILHLRTQ